MVRELSPPGFQVRRGMSCLDVFSLSQNFLLFLNALCSYSACCYAVARAGSRCWFLGRVTVSLWISPRAPRLRNLRSRNSSSLDRTDSGAHHVILEPPLVFRQISARLSHAPVSAGGLLWVTARPNINVLSRSGSNQFDYPVNIRYLDASPWWYGGGLRFVVSFRQVRCSSSCGVLRAHLLL